MKTTGVNSSNQLDPLIAQKQPVRRIIDLIDKTTNCTTITGTTQTSAIKFFEDKCCQRYKSIKTLPKKIRH